MSKLKKLVIFLSILVIAIPTVFAGVVYSKLKTMHNGDDFDMLKTNKYKFDNNITNILLLGSDARPGEDVSRSDSMMILTVDTKHKKMKITSLGRDTYVKIPGHGYEKLTHAYAYGKEKLVIETIEDNFRLDLQYYAKVDFFSFIDTIDALGGVEVDVKESEINELNKFVKECYDWDKKEDKPPFKEFTKTGKQNLKGYQALAFSRIRKNDGTMQRDDRQRQVIEAIVTKLEKTSVSKYPKILNAVKPYVKTNMSPSEMMALGMDVIDMENLHMVTQQFPFHPENEVRLPHAGYVIPFELYEIDLLHKFIFDDKKPSEEDIKNATIEWQNSGRKSQYADDDEYINAGLGVGGDGYSETDDSYYQDGNTDSSYEFNNNDRLNNNSENFSTIRNN